MGRKKATSASSDRVAEPVWLTISEAADRLSVSDKTIRRMIGAGDLPASRYRGVIRVRTADVDAVLTPMETSKSPEAKP